MSSCQNLLDDMRMFDSGQAEVGGGPEESAAVGVHGLGFQQIQGGQQIGVLGFTSFWKIGSCGCLARLPGFVSFSADSICWPP
jgi:hypothetical protein